MTVNQLNLRHSNTLVQILHLHNDSKTTIKPQTVVSNFYQNILMQDRDIIYDELRMKMEDAGFQFEREQQQS
jgi:hypothetical protein